MSPAFQIFVKEPCFFLLLGLRAAFQARSQLFVFPFCLRQQIGAAQCIPRPPRASPHQNVGTPPPSPQSQGHLAKPAVWVGLGELVSLSFLISLKNDHFFTFKRKASNSICSRDLTQAKLKHRNINSNVLCNDKLVKNDKLIKKCVCKEKLEISPPKK